MTRAEVTRRLPDGKKGTAVLTSEILGPNGEIVNGNGPGSPPNEQSVHLHLYGYRLMPGEYHVRVTYLGYGEFDRGIRIP